MKLFWHPELLHYQLLS